MSQITLTKRAITAIANAEIGKVNIFVDSADSITKAKDENGNVYVLQADTVIPQVVSTPATTVTTQDYVVHNPTASGTVQLPTAVGRTKKLFYINISSFDVTVSPQSGQTINGDVTYSFLSGYPNTSLIFVPVGGNWYAF